MISNYLLVYTLNDNYSGIHVKELDTLLSVNKFIKDNKCSEWWLTIIVEENICKE